MSLTLLSPRNQPYEENKSDLSQTSESSLKPRSDKRIKQVRIVSKRQIEQLNDKVKAQLQKNRKNYERLTSINPYFSMKLFTPQNHFSPDQHTTEAVQLMMKQLELLLDDGHTLEKEIMKNQLRSMQNQFKQTQDLDQWRHHYASLRKVWISSNEDEAFTATDMLQQLNKKVVIIKNNIFSMIDLEKQQYKSGVPQHSQHYTHVTRKIEEVAQSVAPFNELHQRYENLKMAYEDMETQFNRYVQQMNEQLRLKNEALDKLKQDNDQLKKIAKQFKSKLVICQTREADLLNKIKELEGDSKEKKQQRQSLQNSVSLSHLKTPDFFNIERIKFTKLETSPLIINTKDEEKRETKRQNHLTISVCDTTDNNKVQIKPFSVDEDNGDVGNNPNQENQEDNDRMMDLSSARSLQKKGRFVRMRSPCNGKLMKARDEQSMAQRRKPDFLPQKIKDMKQRKGQESNLIRSQK